MAPVSVDDEEGFPPLVAIRRLRYFWRTRSAVRAGKRLCDIPKEERNRRGFMGPVKFNLLKTALAGGIAIVGVRSLSLLPTIGSSLEPPGSIRPPPADSVTAQRNAQKITELVSPTLPAVWLFILSQLLAWASLKSADVSRKALRRARWEYLYLDGAYGLIPQALLGFSAPLYGVFLASRQNPTLPFTCLAAIPFFAVFIWQWLITGRLIPARLFALNGYSRGPLTKYQFVLVVLAPLVGLLVATGARLRAWLGGFLTARIGLNL